MTEEDVTRRLAASLAAHDWCVLAVHWPGSQGGTYILRSPRPRPATKGAVVLDIVARRGATYLLVESKDRYYSPDVRKIAALVTDLAYRECLGERFGIDWATRPTLVPAIAVPEDAALPLTLSGGVIAIAVGGRGGAIVRGTPQVALPGVARYAKEK